MIWVEVNRTFTASDKETHDAMRMAPEPLKDVTNR